MNLRHRGFSLIELMVAITLGLLILAGVLTIFSKSKQGYQVQQSTGRALESTRFAMDYLNTNIRLADFWGGARPPTVTFASATPATASGCANTNWIVDPNNGIRGYQGGSSISNITPADTTLTTCLTAVAPGYVPNSDVLVLRYVNPDVYTSVECASVSSTTTDCPNGSPITAASGYWVRSLVDLKGELFNSTTLSTVNTDIPNNYNSFGAAIQNYQYQAVVFYLAESDNGAGTTPTLFMMTVSGTTFGTPQALVDGVEMMKFVYGVDPTQGTSASDYSINQYVPAAVPTGNSNPVVTNWAQVLSVRVALIVRGDTLDNFTDTQTYQMTDSFCYGPSGSGCGATYSGSSAVPNTSASYQRRLIVKDILLRNRVRQ
jgi:prepilin-type N-terminal cleavage/methylation domain-containing protein